MNMPAWFEVASALSDINNYKSFLESASKDGAAHAYTEELYRAVVDEVKSYKTNENSWAEAWFLYREQKLSFDAEIEATIKTGLVHTGTSISRCCNNEPPSKSMLDLLKNGGYAAAKWALSGFKIVSKEQQDARLDECEKCGSLITHQWRCSECGCFVKVKAWMATESCPMGKWQEIP